MPSYAQLCSTTPRALTKPDPRGLFVGKRGNKIHYILFCFSGDNLDLFRCEPLSIICSHGRGTRPLGPP